MDETERLGDPMRDLGAMSLHNAAQAAIAQGIRTAWSTKRSYSVRRPCADCNRVESWDATDGLSEVRTEATVASGRRADILLEYKRGIRVAIEIVVTNDIVPGKRWAYEKADIRCLRVVPTAENLDGMLTTVSAEAEGVNPETFRCADCAALNTVAESTRVVRETLQPRCVQCGESLELLSVYVVQTDCWKCEEPMLQAFGQTGRGARAKFVRPSELPRAAVAAAVSGGAILRVHYSRTTNDTYRSNTCDGCGAFVGKFYMFTAVVDALYEIYDPDSTLRPVQTFGYCPTCTPIDPLKPTEAEIQDAKDESDARYHHWRQERMHQEEQEQEEAREEARQQVEMKAESLEQQRIEREAAREAQSAAWKSVNEWLREHE